MGASSVQLGVAASALVVLVVVVLLGLDGGRRIAEREAVNDAAQAHGPGRRGRRAARRSTTRSRAPDPAPSPPSTRPSATRCSGRESSGSSSGTPRGAIVYSDEPRLIGQPFPLGERRARRADDTRAPRPRSATWTAGERVRARPGQAARGLPAGLDTGGSRCCSRRTAATTRSATSHGQLWRGFAGITVDQPRCCSSSCWSPWSGARRPAAPGPAAARGAAAAGRRGVRRGAAADRRHAARRRRCRSSPPRRSPSPARPRPGRGSRATPSSAAGCGRPPTVRASIARAALAARRHLPAEPADARGCAAALHRPGRRPSAARRRRRASTCRRRRPRRSTDEQERLVYRVAQEACATPSRTRGAATVTVRCTATTASVVLEVADDGVGFDPVAVRTRPPEGHFGLRVLADLRRPPGARARGRRRRPGPAPTGGWRSTALGAAD